MVRLQHKPHHLGTPLSYTGTLGSGEGPPSLIVLTGIVGSPPMLWLYGTSKKHFYFGTPGSFGALAASVVPKALATSNGHNFMVQASNLMQNHSIGIYSLCRCRWTPHVLHSDKYSLSYALSKLQDSRATLPRLCCPHHNTHRA